MKTFKASENLKHAHSVAILALSLFSILVQNGDAALSPARKITGIWETPFPVVVKYRRVDGFGDSTCQCKVRVRWRIQAAGNRAVIRSQPIGRIRDFRIVDAGGGDPGIIEPLARDALQNLSVNTVFRGSISSSRLDVTFAGKRVGRFSFTTDLMRGPYQYIPTPETIYTIQQLKLVKKS